MRFKDAVKTLDVEKHGFHVVSDVELKNIQRILLNALSDFSDFCRERDISWSMFGGSVLGTVRHRGFIPWDDDIDLFMTRSEIDKLKAVRDEYSDRYEIKFPGDGGYYFHYPKIFIKETKAVTIDSANPELQELFIDIFILEDMYDNRILRFIHGLGCTALLFIDSVVRTERCRDFMYHYCGDDKVLKKEIDKRAIWARLFKFRTIEQWMAVSDRYFSKPKNSKSKFVVCPSGALHYFGEIYERDKMCNTSAALFEGMEVMIPGDAEYYLKTRYGSDYMKIPPKEKQEKHTYVKLDLSGLRGGGDAVS